MYDDIFHAGAESEVAGFVGGEGVFDGSGAVDAAYSALCEESDGGPGEEITGQSPGKIVNDDGVAGGFSGGFEEPDGVVLGEVMEEETAGDKVVIVWQRVIYGVVAEEPEGGAGFFGFLGCEGDCAGFEVAPVDFEGNTGAIGPPPEGEGDVARAAGDVQETQGLVGGVEAGLGEDVGPEDVGGAGGAVEASQAVEGGEEVAVVHAGLGHQFGQFAARAQSVHQTK